MGAIQQAIKTIFMDKETKVTDMILISSHLMNSKVLFWIKTWWLYRIWREDHHQPFILRMNHHLEEYNKFRAVKFKQEKTQ